MKNINELRMITNLRIRLGVTWQPSLSFKTSAKNVMEFVLEKQKG